MRFLVALVVINVATSIFAEDFIQPEESLITTTLSFRPADKDPTPGQPVLDQFDVVDGQSSPDSVKVSGRVISNNSGGPIENVAIYINSSLHEPRLAALTNVDGEFKFRLGVGAGKGQWPVEVTQDWEGDLLLFGGGRWNIPIPNRLLSGQVYRYRLPTLKKLSEKR